MRLSTDHPIPDIIVYSDTFAAKPSVWNTSGYVKKPSYKIVPHFLGFNIPTVSKWIPIFGIWGAAAGIGALFLIEGVPRTRQDILSKIPIIGEHWIREIPASDNPF
ncbi:ubiquinol-cytochrome-c reductase complex subunit-domain-containing protein [Yarrowia lipolytica]|nr:ubiquinol-cytochrome-c reductase complex subunit-domain-containing protein [Yarrowia lipolytica]